MNNFEVGDKVMVECFSGLGTGGPDTITSAEIRYHSKTGEPYRVVFCEEHMFDDKTGNALSAPTAYYITKVT